MGPGEYIQRQVPNEYRTKGHAVEVDNAQCAKGFEIFVRNCAKPQEIGEWFSNAMKGIFHSLKRCFKNGARTAEIKAHKSLAQKRGAV